MNIKTAKISVIVPIYGVEKYLRQCLDSIVNQTLSDIEIILVNDDSKDSCPQIIDEYAQKDERIVVVNKANGGYGSACNVGLEKATGEYISIIEPDDYIDLRMFEDLYNIAQKYNSDIVKSCFYDNLKSKTLTKCQKVKWDDDIIPQHKSFTVKECPLFLYYHPSIWSCIYKKEFINSNNIRFVEAPSSGWTDNPFQVQTMCLAQRINYTTNAYYYWLRLNENEADDLNDWHFPFKRSDEIHRWIDENKIDDCEILGCLAAREIAYIHIVMNKKFSKKEKKEVIFEMKKMLERMDYEKLKLSKFIKSRSLQEMKMLKNNLELYWFLYNFKSIRRKIIRLRISSNEISFKFLKFNKIYVIKNSGCNQ